MNEFNIIHHVISRRDAIGLIRYYSTTYKYWLSLTVADYDCDTWKTGAPYRFLFAALVNSFTRDLIQ